MNVSLFFWTLCIKHEIAEYHTNYLFLRSSFCSVMMLVADCLLNRCERRYWDIKVCSLENIKIDDISPNGWKRKPKIAVNPRSRKVYFRLKRKYPLQKLRVRYTHFRILCLCTTYCVWKKYFVFLPCNIVGFRF